MFNKQVNPSQKTTPFQSRFRLPIEYLPSQYIHEIPPHVMEDLELCQTTDASLVPMHSHLFQPTHSFAQELLPRWANKITKGIMKKRMGVRMDAMGDTILIVEMDCKKVADSLNFFTISNSI